MTLPIFFESFAKFIVNSPIASPDTENLESSPVAGQLLAKNEILVIFPISTIKFIFRQVLTDSELELHARSMSDLEAGDAAEQIEGAVSDLRGVTRSVSHWYPPTPPCTRPRSSPPAPNAKHEYVN